MQRNINFVQCSIFAKHSRSPPRYSRRSDPSPDPFDQDFGGTDFIASLAAASPSSFACSPSSLICAWMNSV